MSLFFVWQILPSCEVSIYFRHTDDRGNGPVIFLVSTYGSLKYFSSRERGEKNNLQFLFHLDFCRFLSVVVNVLLSKLANRCALSWILTPVAGISGMTLPHRKRMREREKKGIPEFTSLLNQLLSS